MDERTGPEQTVTVEDESVRTCLLSSLPGRGRVLVHRKRLT